MLFGVNHEIEFTRSFFSKAFGIDNGIVDIIYFLIMFMVHSYLLLCEIIIATVFIFLDVLGVILIILIIHFFSHCVNEWNDLLPILLELESVSFV